MDGNLIMDKTDEPSMDELASYFGDEAVFEDVRRLIMLKVKEKKENEL